MAVAVVNTGVQPCDGSTIYCGSLIDIYKAICLFHLDRLLYVCLLVTQSTVTTKTVTAVLVRGYMKGGVEPCM